MSKKDAFINDVISMTNSLAKYYTDRSDELHKSYFDNNFATEITQDDLDRLYPGVSLTDFTGAISLMEQINNLTGNRAVTQADWLAAINKVRISGLV